MNFKKAKDILEKIFHIERIGLETIEAILDEGHRQTMDEHHFQHLSAVALRRLAQQIDEEKADE